MRWIGVTSMFLLLGALSARESAQPESKPPDDRGKIVEQIRADFDHAVGKLNKNDPGASTRAAQRRILDNIDRLLDQDPPPPAQQSQSPPPSRNSPPPQPKPMPETSHEARPTPESAPAKPEAKSPAQAEIARGNAQPRNLEQMQKENRGAWQPQLPWRPRPEMEAYGRDQFIRRYEELLREYYRALARGGDE